MDLPEYFGFPECNEQYALGVRQNTNIAAQIGRAPVALLSLHFPYQNNGIGQKLIYEASSYAKRQGQVLSALKR